MADNVGGTDDAPSTEPRYQIGEVATRTGLTQRTLRFYEEKELVTPADRMEGGFRLYSDADIERVALIKKLQDLLGFTLADIKEMVQAEELRAQIRATRRSDRDLPERRKRVEQVIAALRRQLEVVEPKIEQLLSMRSDLGERLAFVEQRLAQIDDELATRSDHAPEEDGPAPDADASATSEPKRREKRSPAPSGN